MGIIFKIAFAVFAFFVLKSWVTDKTLDRLPDQIPSLSDVHLPHLEKEAKDEEANKRDTTDRIRLNNYSSFDGAASDCTSVDRAFGQSFLKPGMNLVGLENPRIWSIQNDTNKTLAIVLGQNNSKFAVAYLPRDATYTAKIPSSSVIFVIKAVDGRCINHRAAGGLRMPDPSSLPAREGGISGDFVTTISLNKGSVSFSNTTGISQ